MLRRHHRTHNKDVPENNWTHVGSWGEVASGAPSMMHQAVRGGGKALGPGITYKIVMSIIGLRPRGQ